MIAGAGVERKADEVIGKKVEEPLKNVQTVRSSPRSGRIERAKGGWYS